MAAAGRCDECAPANEAEVVAVCARSMGLDPAVVPRSVDQTNFGFRRIAPQVVAHQQHIADTFAAEGLLPSTPKVSEAAPEI